MSVKVQLLEMDDLIHRSIVLLFEHLPDNTAVLTCEENADIAVIDLDYHEDSLKKCISLRERSPGLHIIGLSERNGLKAEGVLILSKPVTANRILAGIQQLTGLRLSQTTGIADVARSLGKRATEKSLLHRMEILIRMPI